MADTPTIHINQNSPEKIAYDLTRIIAHMENRKIDLMGTAGCSNPADRQWLLDTYVECLIATKGGR